MRIKILTPLGLSLVLTLIPLQAHAAERIATTFSNGSFFLKEGALNSGWSPITSGVSIGSISLSGDYIGLIDTGGANPNSLSIKSPAWNSPWEPVHTHTAKKVVTTQTSDGNYRILVLQTNGSVVMKDGAWNSGYWSGTLATGVKDVVLGGDNVGVIMENKDFKAKRLVPGQFSHPNNVEWKTVANHASEAVMTDTWVAVLVNGQVIAKDRGIDSWWYGASIYDYATSVQAAGNRICATTKPNWGTRIEVQCKEGALSAVPVLTYVGASKFKINANRFLAMKANGQVEAMEGTLTQNSGWMPIATGAKDIGLN